MSVKGLKPCPFCGELPEVAVYHEDAKIYCRKCHCAETPIAPLEEVITAWNIRAPDKHCDDIVLQGVDFVAAGREADTLRKECYHNGHTPAFSFEEDGTHTRVVCLNTGCSRHKAQKETP